MNSWLAYVNDTLGPLVFLTGAVVMVQVWRLRKNGKPNPVCMVFALMLFAYQARNLQNSVLVWYYSAGLIRPPGLLVNAIIAKLVEASGDVLGILYFSGNDSAAKLLNFLAGPATAIPYVIPTSGDQSVEEWRTQGGTLVRAAIRAEIKPEYLNP